MNRTCKRLSKAGSITLPVQMRRELGIQPGQFLDVELSGGRFNIKAYQHRCIFCKEIIEGPIGTFENKTICESCYKDMGSMDIFKNELNVVNDEKEATEIE